MKKDCDHALAWDDGYEICPDCGENLGRKYRTEDDLELSNELMLAKRSVPWKRFGHPQYKCSRNENEWKFRVLNAGIAI